MKYWPRIQYEDELSHELRLEGFVKDMNLEIELPEGSARARIADYTIVFEGKDGDKTLYKLSCGRGFDNLKRAFAKCCVRHSRKISNLNGKNDLNLTEVCKITITTSRKSEKPFAPMGSFQNFGATYENRYDISNRMAPVRRQ